MFDHYPYVQKQHHVALASTIRSHAVVSTVNATVLAIMYKHALACLDNVVALDGFFSSRLCAEGVTLSSVTEAKTGLWMQLAKLDGKPSLLLTIGQKWAMEQPVPAHGNVATTLW